MSEPHCPTTERPNSKCKRLIRTELQAVIVGFKIAFEVGYRLTVGMPVVNAETTAHVDVPDTYPAGFELIQQLVDTVAQSHKIAHIQYLRTDVEVQSDELDVLHLLQPRLSHDPYLPC